MDGGSSGGSGGWGDGPLLSSSGRGVRHLRLYVHDESDIIFGIQTAWLGL